MMKENLKFKVDTDVNEIEFNVTNAEIEFITTADDKLTVEYPATKGISAGSGKDGLIVTQGKRGLFDRARRRITVAVPQHTVPSVRINGRICKLTLSGGIYSDLSVNIDGGEIAVADGAYKSVRICGGSVNAYISDVTVKSDLFLQIEKGNVLAENSFATRYECSVKKGNIGLDNVNCKDCAFNSNKGNITATIAGSEAGYNTTIVTGEGTANRNSAKHDGADGSFKAYTGQGNITLDFLEQEKENV